MDYGQFRIFNTQIYALFNILETFFLKFLTFGWVLKIDKNSTYALMSLIVSFF